MFRKFKARVTKETKQHVQSLVGPVVIGLIFGRENHGSTKIFQE